MNCFWVKTVVRITITPDGNPTREPSTPAERLLFKRHREVPEGEDMEPSTPAERLLFKRHREVPEGEDMEPSTPAERLLFKRHREVPEGEDMEPSTPAERFLFKRYIEVLEGEDMEECPALDVCQTVVRNGSTLPRLHVRNRMKKKEFEGVGIPWWGGVGIVRKVNGEALGTIMRMCTESKTGEPRDLVMLLKSRPHRYTHLVAHPETYRTWIKALACDTDGPKPMHDSNSEQAIEDLASLGIYGVVPVLDPDMIKDAICCLDARSLFLVIGDMMKASYNYTKEELIIASYHDFETMRVPHGIKFEPSADWSHMGYESAQPIEAYHPNPFVARPDSGQPDHGAGTADSRGNLKKRARALLDRQMYDDCMSLLEEQGKETRCAPEFIKKFIFPLIKDIHSRNRSDQEFDRAIEPYKERIINMIHSIAAAKSLDVPIDTSYSTYHSLWDYASRVSKGQQVMLHDPDFMPWIAENYPNVYQFLMPEKEYVNDKNTFIQMLSVQFNSRQMPHVQQYMRAIDNLCRKTAEACANNVSGYVYKLHTSFYSTKIEMMVLVALNKNFEIKAIDPIISPSKKHADVSFMDGNVKYYVEVYSYKNHDSDAPEVKEDIIPKDEWRNLFRKRQLSQLKQANVPTVYIMNLSDFQFMIGEAKNFDFQEYARRHMPENSEVAVILHGVTVFSIRDGKIAPEKSRLGRMLESSLTETCLEYMHIGTN